MYYSHASIDYIAMIRNFTPADAVACSELVLACIEADRTIPPSLKDNLMRSESHESMLERSRLFYMAVYESGNRISGIAGLDMNEIRILCVLPEAQGHGIGRALLDHIIDMVPGTLFPDIFVYAATEAVAFYKAAGFAEKGPVSFAFADDQLHTVFMIRPFRRCNARDRKQTRISFTNISYIL